MRKKAMSYLLAAVMILGMAGCNESQESSGSLPPGTSGEPPLIQITPSRPDFRETVIADNESCTFKVTSIESDSLWGYTLKVYLENKTDKELMFTLDETSVNGFMCDPFWASTVSAGMKSIEEISFSREALERCGIAEPTDIEANLKIYDSNDWMAENVLYQNFILYPLGEEAVQPYVRTPAENETVLFDNDSCTMIVTGFVPDDLWGYTMEVYLENKTDKTLMFSASDAAVNGFMCDPYWAETVAPGKRSQTGITWAASALEESGITQVESITLPIRVYDNDDIFGDDLVNETFTVTP